MRSAVTFRQGCAAGFLPPSPKFTLPFSTASIALHAVVVINPVLVGAGALS